MDCFTLKELVIVLTPLSSKFGTFPWQWIFKIAPAWTFYHKKGVQCRIVLRSSHPLYFFLLSIKELNTRWNLGYLEISNRRSKIDKHSLKQSFFVFICLKNNIQKLEIGDWHRSSFAFLRIEWLKMWRIKKYKKIINIITSGRFLSQ